MGRAKDIIVKPIKASAARAVIKKTHYSGKVVQNSQLHFGVFLNGKLEGALQFGPSLDKSKIKILVDGTGWNEFIELNRMAFSDDLPRFSESRAIAICIRLIKKTYPQIKWVISFSDGCNCGDGTIYRASGFSLVGIKENSTTMITPSGIRTTKMTLTANWNTPEIKAVCDSLGVSQKPRTITEWRKLGLDYIKGYQLKYVYFIDKSAKEKLTVPILPFSKIDEVGAGMYKGISRVTKAISGDQLESGGAIPTNTLQSKRLNNG